MPRNTVLEIFSIFFIVRELERLEEKTKRGKRLGCFHALARVHGKERLALSDSYVTS